jgi:hypothetical protein
MNLDELQAWPDKGPPVPIHMAWDCDWAVAIIENGKVNGMYVHKNESARDMEIQAAKRPEVSYVLVADLHAVDRRWKIAYHR